MALRFDNPTLSGNLIFDAQGAVTGASAFAGVLAAQLLAVFSKCTGTVPAAGGFLDGDSDPDGDAISYTITEQPSHGTLTPYIDGAFLYVPDSGYVGRDFFSYELFAACESGGVNRVPIDVTGEYAGILFTQTLSVSGSPVQLSAGYAGALASQLLQLINALLAQGPGSVAFAGVLAAQVLPVAPYAPQLTAGQAAQLLNQLLAVNDNGVALSAGFEGETLAQALALLNISSVSVEASDLVLTVRGRRLRLRFVN